MYSIVNDSIIKRHDGVFIPVNEDSEDYQAYLSWLEQGNTPEPLLTVEEQRLAARAAIQSQLSTLEAKAFMRRGQRESWLAQATQQLTVQGITHAQAYAANPEYKRVFDENQEATALRNQLKNL